MTNIRFTPLITCLFAVFILTACTEFSTGQYDPWGQPTSPVDQTKASAPAPPTKPIIKGQFDNLPSVNVAILLPLSGSKSALGQSMLQGAQLALFEMGYANFNLMPRDTAGTQAGAVTAATAAINDGAQIILGPLFSDSVRAIKPIARSHNIKVIAFSTDWTLADNNTFLMGFMPFSQVDRVTRYALAKGYKDFAIIAPQDQYGNAVSGQFTEIALKNGGKIATAIRYKSNDIQIVERIKNIPRDPQGKPNFNAVFMPVTGTQTDMVGSALSYNKMDSTQVKRLGTGLWDDPRIARQPNVQGGWFAAPSPAARRAFEGKYKNAYGVNPARLSTLAYDATALAAILAKNGYKKGNRPAYDYNSLTNPNGFAGTDGVFRFKKNGIVERGLAVLELRQGTIVEIDRAPTRF